jgi:hypothetical protein
MNIEPPMHDEKYISIPYDLWLSKYKLLEEENERLKQDIASSEIRVNIYASSYQDKTDAKNQLIDNKIKSLPRIVRWLFNIK